MRDNFVAKTALVIARMFVLTIMGMGAFLPCVFARESETGIIKGFVVDGSTGDPVIAAMVIVENEDSATFTNRSGEFTVKVPKGKRTLAISATDFLQYHSKKLVIKKGTTSTIHVELTRVKSSLNQACDTCKAPSVIIGKVEDKLRHIPVNGASLTLLGTMKQTTSSEDGVFSFEGIGTIDYTIAVTHKDFVADTLSGTLTSIAGVTPISIQLTPHVTPEDETGIILGMIRDASTNTPLANVSVSLLNTDMSALADSSGKYELRLVPPGRYSVVISKWGFETKILSGIAVRAKEEVLLDVPLPTREIELQASKGKTGIVEGVITDNEGKPCANAMVLLKETGDWGNSNPLGKFRIDSVKAGVYTAVVAAEGYQMAEHPDIDVWNDETAQIAIQLLPEVDETADKMVLGSDPDRGAIVGIVVDSETGQPIGGVSLKIDNIQTKVITNPQGHFVAQNLKPGTVTIKIAHSGYKEIESEPILVTAGNVTSQDFVLARSGITEMQQMSIRATAPQSTGAALLKERQSAMSFTDAIGAQEMSRTGASNAADAMKSVTGATVVGGKYVLIRGLPERYTLTMLNGSPIPSPDPDRQAVNMDMFPAGMIENITTSKTFVPDLPANFAGGVVDIRTKPFPDKLSLSVGASSSFNSQTTFNSHFLTYKGGNLDWLGFDDGTRAMPDVLNDYTKDDLDKLPNINFDFSKNAERLQDPNDKLRDTIAIIDRLAREMGTEMQPHESVAPPNQNYSLSLGNTITLAGRPLGFRIGLSYSNAYKLSLNDEKVSWDFNKFQDATNSYPAPNATNDYKLTNAKNTILLGGLITSAYRLSDEHIIKLDCMYTQNAIDHVQQVKGRFGYYEQDGVFDTRRLHYTERSLIFLQPNGSHVLWVGSTPLRIKWKGSYTRSTQDEPDLRNMYHFKKVDSLAGTVIYNYPANVGDPSQQWRTLNEKAGTAALNVAIPFWQWTGDSATFSFGGLWYRKNRKVRRRRIEFGLDQYIQNLLGGYKSDINPNDLSVQELVSEEHVGIWPDSTTKTGFRPGLLAKDMSEEDAQWDGYLNVASGYFMVQLPLIGNFSTTAGIRYEWASMFGQPTDTAFQNDTTIARLNDHDILPSASLAYALRDNMNIRGAYGRTLVRPSLREKAPYDEEAFTGGNTFLGNPNLKRSLIDNVDLRWEWFVKPGELVAASAFYKRIHDPIELKYVGGNDTEFPINTPSNANLWGIEIEVRKQLDMIPPLRYFQIAGNYTLARSRVELDSAKLDQAEMAKNYKYFPDEPNYRPFQGQSPYVVNLFLTFDQPDWGTNINLLYNVFGERMAKLTEPDVAWLWEQPQHLLHATANQKIGTHISVKFKASNILGSTKKSVHHYAGIDLLESESFPGRSFSLGLSYSF